MQDIFNTVLSSAASVGSIDVVQFLICTLMSLVLGLIAAVIYTYKHNYNKSFVVTLAVLPAVVQLVIMLVNGNLGAGLAVMGAFALVRFRSIPGSAKDIAAVFFSMAIGLATGMGFLGIAALFTLVISAVNVIYASINFGNKPGSNRQLKITIPETLDYEAVFDSIFSRYTTSYELHSLKTSNMGSLYKLYYNVSLKPDIKTKQFIDDLRTRNGNLEIALGRDIFRTVNGGEL